MRGLVLTVVSLWGLTLTADAAGLDDLARVAPRTSHRASSHDRSGGNEDSLVSFAPGETPALLETAGPGRITHMWFTAARFPGHVFFLRDIILRMYWEGSPVPSVEVPLGDFFGLGHGRLYAYQSVPMSVGANPAAMNCYWPMPFRKHARIELFNAGNRSIRRVYFNIDYELGELPPGQALFHALYRRDRALPGQSSAGNTSGAENYVILQAEGQGHYVGCTLSVDAQPGGWWGEGDEMIFIDGSEKPVIMGTGSEDYFCNAWGYREPFSYPFYGAPLLENKPDGGKLATVYRWHVPDPVRFASSIKVTIEHLWRPEVLNDYTTVAYWYQTEPIRRRPPLPSAEANLPGTPLASAEPTASRPAGAMQAIDATELEPDCLARGIEARSITANLHAGYSNGGWLRIETGGEPVELHVPVPAPGNYRVQLKPVNHVLDGSLRMSLKGGDSKIFEKITPPADQPWTEARVPFIDLGVVASSEGDLVVLVDGGPVIGFDEFRLINTAGSPVERP